MTKSMISRMQHRTSEPYYDQPARDRDESLVEAERTIEGINPNETFRKFVIRKHSETL